MRVKWPGVLLFALLAACGQDDNLEKTQATDSKSYDMQVIGIDEWPAQREQYIGKILVVDLWASWCISCIERFPAMVEMSRAFRDQPVQFVSLNLDDPEDAHAIKWFGDFLRKMRADFPHYRVSDNIMLSFEALDLLSIPAVFIYDQQGVEHVRLSGDDPDNQFTEKRIEQAIEALLAQS